MQQDLAGFESVALKPRATPALARLARKLLLKQLARLERGRLKIIDADETHCFGGTDTAPEVTVRVLNPRFYLDALLGGSTGAGEAYVEGLWQCEDLTGLVRLMIRNRAVLEGVDSGWSALRALLLKAAHTLNRNTLAGSRRNIAAHYDLSNELFELFLDKTMTYSCGIFEHAEATLEEASVAKFDAALSKLGLKPGQHLLEIGTGWGGLAMHAAAHYGLKVTTTTISRAQHEYACAAVHRAGLSDRVNLLLEDYRNLRGNYDGVVSIEMVEAVGHQYLDDYMSRCSALMKSDGVMLLQAITLQDQFYKKALSSVDFIQRYIFPGSFIPSVQALVEAVARCTDLKLFHLEDIGPHYARTLACWRERFLANAKAVRALGFGDSFLRLWEYYLCYCEGGFEERQLGDVQMLLTKPRARRPALSIIHAPPA